MVGNIPYCAWLHRITAISVHVWPPTFQPKTSHLRRPPGSQTVSSATAHAAACIAAWRISLGRTFSLVIVTLHRCAAEAAGYIHHGYRCSSSYLIGFITWVSYPSELTPSIILVIITVGQNPVALKVFQHLRSARIGSFSF